MNIEDQKVVDFHYTLTNEQGETVESSRERDPMSYLHGANNIIPGLEQAMNGRAAGDTFEVTVQPADAYGERQEANVQRIPLKRLGKIPRPRPGQILGLQTQQGPVQVTVIKVGRFNVDVDANHPLAGQALTFDVEIVGVRDATEEEISHGHAHGPGGHQHD
ncbi:MAG: FKBP-type peptidyl-prolyl cis-trans isomerase [Lysobacterales bacterium]|jgi:FKBP-type peptidyl-prolyl cis-trans isomerase SlyD